VDWLAGPICAEDPAEGLDAEDVWLAPPATQCAPDQGFGRAGYTRWRGDVHGTKVARRHERGRDGEFLGYSRTYVILKGSGLTALRAEGLDDQGAVRRFAAWDGKCSRLDLAIDVQHQGVTPGALYDLHQRRRFVTRLQTPGLFGDRDKGQTFYLFGKHQTFRAYDKTAERLRKGATIAEGVTRLEMELRGPWAKRAYRAMLAIDPVTWDDEFPRFVTGLILGKARPLDVVRPETNAQRAPVWRPLEEALRDVATVRLAADEMRRCALQRFDGQVRHFRNDLQGTRVMLEMLGDATFLQAVREGKLDLAHADLLNALRADCDAARAIIAKYGIQPPGVPTDRPATEAPPELPL
jgi:hypothetical protein